MQWREEGLLIAVRRHGEGSAIIEVFTETHGRHAGIVRGGGSRKMAPVLQPGAQLSLEWRARLAEHLGSFRVDPLRSRAVEIMADRRTLAAMGAISALLSICLPEREPHPRLYADTIRLLDAIGAYNDWPALYAIWELSLLQGLGFGLDLRTCAATGSTRDLIYVSPRSGRAVSRDGGADHAGKLLRLPRFLRDADLAQSPQPGELDDALRLTGFFLRKWLMPAIGRESVPDARARLVAVLTEKAKPQKETGNAEI